MTTELSSIRTLYLCYFGLHEPLVQTQVLPYLRELAKAGIKVHLLTFQPRLAEEGKRSDLAQQRKLLADEGISWFYLPYHKRPSVPATAYDIRAGARFAVELARREGINVFHARAHVPAAMALWAQRFVNVKFIFDIRGLMAEEYRDAGIWAEGSFSFRLVKRVERAAIRRADQLIVLSERMKDWMVANKQKPPEQIEAIPCCVDFARFVESDPILKDESTPPLASNNFEIVYAGSLIGLYLVEEMGRFIAAIKRLRPNAFLRLLSASPPEQGAAALRRAGLNERDFEIRVAHPSEIPAYLRRAHLGLSFRKPAFAQIAASPTKIPEYLAAGLPVVCNAGIGDMDRLVERERVGVVMREFSDDAYETAAAEALLLADDATVRSNCQRIAREYFDLHRVGGPRYVRVYRKLLAGSV